MASWPEPGSTEQARSFVDRAYLAILGRSADPRAAGAIVKGLLSGALQPVDVVLQLTSSEEFGRRIGVSDDGPDRQLNGAPEKAAGYIEPADLIAERGIEGLLAAAEEYFQGCLGSDHLFAKPFWSVVETPELLVSFGHLISGLHPLPDDTVLDFGAGSCWTSRSFSQLGTHVIALDPSPTALELGRELYRRYPPAGARPEPRFLLFDGHKIDLPDESVDLVSSFDAFHHVPNPNDVLKEFFRVLRPGGVIGFSEPADKHSTDEVAQHEMREFGVLENDIVLGEVAETMLSIGFVEVAVNVFSVAPFLVALPAFEDFLAGGPAGSLYADATRRGLFDRRMWFAHKPGERVPDSRDMVGLAGALEGDGIEVRSTSVGWQLSGTVRVRNTGTSHWRPSTSVAGPVKIGVRARVGDSPLVDLARIPLPGSEMVAPGDELTVPVDVEIERSRIPAAGEPALELSLVSELVAWFADRDGERVRIVLGR